jgi:DNA-binding NtrC family response regulator
MEAAGGGTLFLDEIGDLSLELQPKLLRVLQEGAYYRLGGKTKRPFKARVIAASNHNLNEMTASGRFRADLYHRIHVGYIYIPPLRQRREEIPCLTELFLARAAWRMGEAPKSLSDRALSYLTQREWTGNVRELSNTLYRAMVLSRSETIRLADVASPAETICAEPEDGATGGDPGGLRRPILTLSGIDAIGLPEDGLDLEGLAEAVIRKVLAKFDGNKSRAARYLGISRHSLHRRLSKTPQGNPHSARRP